MHLCRETPVAFDKITSSIEKIDSGEIDECTLDAFYFLVSHVGFRVLISCLNYVAHAKNPDAALLGAKMPSDSGHERVRDCRLLFAILLHTFSCIAPNSCSTPDRVARAKAAEVTN